MCVRGVSGLDSGQSWGWRRRFVLGSAKHHGFLTAIAAIRLAGKERRLLIIWVSVRLGRSCWLLFFGIRRGVCPALFRLLDSIVPGSRSDATSVILRCSKKTPTQNSTPLPSISTNSPYPTPSALSIPNSFLYTGHVVGWLEIAKNWSCLGKAYYPISCVGGPCQSPRFCVDLWGGGVGSRGTWFVRYIFGGRVLVRCFLITIPKRIGHTQVTHSL